jgi:hypothetical protein
MRIIEAELLNRKLPAELDDQPLWNVWDCLVHKAVASRIDTFFMEVSDFYAVEGESEKDTEAHLCALEKLGWITRKPCPGAESIKDVWLLRLLPELDQRSCH